MINELAGEFPIIIISYITDPGKYFFAECKGLLNTTVMNDRNH